MASYGGESGARMWPFFPSLSTSGTTSNAKATSLGFTIPGKGGARQDVAQVRMLDLHVRLHGEAAQASRTGQVSWDRAHEVAARWEAAGVKQTRPEDSHACTVLHGSCPTLVQNTVPSVPDSNWLSSLSADPADHRSRSSWSVAFCGLVGELLQLSGFLPYAFVPFQSFRLAKT